MPARRDPLLAMRPAGIEVRVGDGGSATLLPYHVVSIDDGLWHHLTVIWDAGAVKLIMDGIESQTTVDGPAEMNF